jgi:hypothetical protein
MNMKRLKDILSGLIGGLKIIGILFGGVLVLFALCYLFYLAVR